MTDIKTIGKIGENMVADYLRKKGCIIVKRNYRTRFGEIDVIAEDKEHTNNEKTTVEVNGKEKEVYVPFAMISGAILPVQRYIKI